MIKAVIFDMGGVVIPYYKRQIFNHAAKQVDISTRKLEKAVPKHLDELMKGRISDYEFWKRVLREAGKPVRERITKDVWHKKFVSYGPKKSMMKLIKKLKRRYKIGVITNTIGTTHAMQKRRGHYDLFGVVIASNIVGLLKPDQKIYTLAAKQLRVTPKDCVFIDDVKENLKPARKLGMKTVHFRNVSQLKADLKKLGLIL